MLVTGLAARSAEAHSVAVTIRHCVVIESTTSV